MLESGAIPELQPKAQPYKRFDEHSLFLLIQPHGGKWWRLNYRYGGRQKTISLGCYPDVSLEEARVRRDEAKRLLAKGSDPSAVRAKSNRDGGTLGLACCLRRSCGGYPGWFY